MSLKIKQLFAQILCLILFFEAGNSASAKSISATTHLTVETAAVPEKTQTDAASKIAVKETEKLVAEIVKNSYPELVHAQISVQTFESRSDYFRSRFSFARFLTFRKPHYLIFVNPLVFGKNAPPAEAVRAIIAHEIAHIAYYVRHNRFELFGLIALESKSFTARFERGADLQAIKRGYGAGLKLYREWLYQNIPDDKIADKKRDYFSPEEIDLILNASEMKPELIDFWIKNVPRSLTQIKTAIK